MVRHRTAEANVLQSHVLQGEQRAQSFVETSGMAAQFVVFLAQSFDGDADAYVRELFRQSHYAVLEPSRSGNHDTRRMLVTLRHDFLQVFPNKRFASRQVDELQLRQRLQVLRLDFLLSVCRVFPDVTHLATHRTAIRQNDTCVRWTRDV